MRKQSGLLLTELIVVLVILAVLSAVLAPLVSGYIRRAKEQVVLTHARSARLAAQTLLTELYAAGGADACPELTLLGCPGPGAAASPLSRTELLRLAQLPADSVAEIRVSYDDSASLIGFLWMEQVNGAEVAAIWNGKDWTIRRGGWNSEENPPGFGNKD